MGEFSAAWLHLREPVDAASRARHLARATGEALGHAAWVHVLDLGAGTGSNTRYLAGYLPRRQRWILADADAALLGQVGDEMYRWATGCGYTATFTPEGLEVSHGAHQWDIRTRLGSLAALDDEELFAGQHLVTASALLDLVSRHWVEALAVRCHAQGALVHMALSYDGRIECSPADPDDGLVRTLVNEHQVTDKGFGPALGPSAASETARSLERLAYRVERHQSDWLLGPGDREMQEALVQGWASAAASIAPEHAGRIEAWATRRQRVIEAGTSSLVVGHEDLLAHPPRPPR